MKFALFAGENYYPQGGWHDLDTVADDLEFLYSRIRIVTKSSYGDVDPDDPQFVIAFDDGFANIDWWHIVDTSTGEIIACQNDKEVYSKLAGYED